MAHRLYMDVHIPAAATAGLRSRGIDVLTAQEDNFDQADDEALLQRATALGRVLVTHDKDFFAIANEQQHLGQEFTGVIAIRQAGTGIGTMVGDLELIVECANDDELANRVTYVPL